MKAIVKKLFVNTPFYQHLTTWYDIFNEIGAALKCILSLSITVPRSRNVFFFPFYHTGGAEKAHLEIVKTVQDRKPVVFFTGVSADTHYKDEFSKIATCYDIAGYLRVDEAHRRVIRRAVENVIIYMINRRRSPLTIFGCISRFYYEILPRIRENVRCTDLIHAFVHEGEDGAEHWSLNVAERLNSRVVVSNKTKQDLIRLYKRAGLPERLSDRIEIIFYKISIPPALPEKDYEGKLRILYVGRNSPEKRIHLIGRIARNRADSSAIFTFIGDRIIDAVDPGCRTGCEFAGAITDNARLSQYYSDAHIVIITSSREGFPLTLMEGMAHGVVPISTNVGGIPEHIRDGENGFLIDNRLSENDIVNSVSEKISYLEKNRDVLKAMSAACYTYARLNFSGERFGELYRGVLINKGGCHDSR